MALDFSKDNDRTYKYPRPQPRVVQLCPVDRSYYGQWGDTPRIVCLALCSNGKIYGVDKTGLLFILEEWQ